MRCERYSGGAGGAVYPGGKRRGRGKRGCRGGTFGRVSLFFRVVLVWRMRGWGVMRCARWRVFSYPGVRRASAGAGVKRCCGVIAECGGGLGGSRRGLVVRVPRVGGFLVYPRVRGRNGVGTFSRVTGWWCSAAGWCGRRRRAQGVMKCERYARGLQCWWRAAGQSTPG